MKVYGFSTALFSTWILVEDFGLLLDAGDGVSSGLLSKSRRARTIAISHADRDHVCGLLQFNQLNAGHTIDRILYPADSGSFPAIRDFMARFDPHTDEAYPWIGVRPGDRIPAGSNLALEVVSNTHVDSQQVKSVGYLLRSVKRKLKPEFAAMPPAEIERLAKQRGRDELSNEVSETLLGYAGDTGVEDADKWQGCGTLIHEATFINREDATSTRSRNLHSVLDDVLKMATEAQPERLLLHHFSTRYGVDQIRSEIKRLSAEVRLTFPVYAIMPGEIARDVFDQPPVYWT